MSTDGFLVCREHGDIFWTQGADGGTVISRATAEPIHGQAPEVVDGGDMVCFCGRPMFPVLRPSVHVQRKPP